MNSVAKALLPAALLLAALPAFPQTLTDRLQTLRPQWEAALERGDAASVRQAVEGLLQKEAQSVSPSDYNEMYALTTARNFGAKAAVLEGDWEAAVAMLQAAGKSAAENALRAQATLGPIQKQHEERLAQWKKEMADQEQRLKALEGQVGMTEAQLKTRQQLKVALDERRKAIQHSETSLRTIQEILSRLSEDKLLFDKSAAEWNGFIAKEKLEIAQAGSVGQFVVDKLEQVKSDDAKPRFDRLAYGRRLRRLDASNQDCQRFVNGLMGIEDPPELQEKPKPPPPRKRRKK
ncbi:MAG: hypothetical protein KGN80_04950 [Acidobacteriota bacterium]|nr:hypothetical protein [Acidobacteriota bacterium]